jgi:hypothetical protein
MARAQRRMSVFQELLNPPHVGDIFGESFFDVDCAIALCFLCGYRMLYCEHNVFSRVFLYNVVQDVPFLCYFTFLYCYGWWSHALFCVSFVVGNSVTLYALGLLSFTEFIGRCTIYLLPLGLAKLLEDVCVLWNIGHYINTWLDDNWCRFSLRGLFCVVVCFLLYFYFIYCLMVVVYSRK